MRNETMIEQPASSPSVRDLVELLFRHKKKIIFCPLLAIGLGVLVLLFCPRTYRSEAKMFLRVGRETVGLDPTATTGQTVAFQTGDRKDEVKSAIQVVGGRGVVAKVVDRLGPEVVLGQTGVGVVEANPLAELLKTPLATVRTLVRQIDPISAREEAIVEIERHLYVDAERESTVIEVQFDADTPELAQLVCDAIVDVYQQEHLRIYRSDESRPFFTQQRDLLCAQLDDALQRLRDAKNEMGISSVDQRRATLEAQFSSVELERINKQQQLATTAARVADLDRQLAKLPERLVDAQRSIPNQGADLLRDQLYQLEIEAMDLEARYSDSHPLVQTIKQQLAEAQEVVAGQSDQRLETTDAVNPIYRQLSLELKQQKSVLAGLEAGLEELQQQKAAVLTDLRALNRCEVKLDQLQRQADLTRSKYFQYSRNLEEARMDKELEVERISNLSVVQPATFAQKPVSPSRLLVAVATFVLATAGTASLVFASERFNDQDSAAADADELNGAPGPESIPDRRRYVREARPPANGDRRSQPAEPQVLHE
jgi:uncharacterized protein involved in exopolysaccharide biosynthesis